MSPRLPMYYQMLDMPLDCSENGGLASSDENNRDCGHSSVLLQDSVGPVCKCDITGGRVNIMV